MAIAHFLIVDAAVVACDAVLTACHVGALMLRNRRGGVERDRVPNHFCSTLPHVMREGEGAAGVRSDDLEATIRPLPARRLPGRHDYRAGSNPMLGRLPAHR